MVNQNQGEKKLNKKYLPNKLLAGSTKESDLFLLQNRFVKDETFIYVCIDNTCKMPVSEIKKAAENSTNNIKAWFTTGQDHNLTKTETVVTIINHITNTHKNKEELCT